MSISKFVAAKVLADCTGFKEIPWEITSSASCAAMANMMMLGFHRNMEQHVDTKVYYAPAGYCGNCYIAPANVILIPESCPEHEVHSNLVHEMTHSLQVWTIPEAVDNDWSAALLPPDIDQYLSDWKEEQAYAVQILEGCKEQGQPMIQATFDGVKGHGWEHVKNIIRNTPNPLDDTHMGELGLAVMAEAKRQLSNQSKLVADLRSFKDRLFCV